MSEFKMCTPCLFGLEGLVGDELKRLGMSDVNVFDGRVTFMGSSYDVARANINLRTAERVLLTVGEFDAHTFDALFEGVKALPWERFIPNNGAFPVKGYSLNSKLHSIPDCQSIIKKAMAERLSAAYKIKWLPEDGAKFQIQFSIVKDRASLYIDTSGAGLHKRGYRAVGADAPLRETLAAALVTLSRYKGREVFLDPFCGSGTIPIEAALIAKNRAPGLGRSFEAMKWDWLPEKLWTDAREEAAAREFSGQYDIRGRDINGKVAEIAASNARKAGVSDCVDFRVSDAAAWGPDSASGVIVTNPPYGERIMDKTAAMELYRSFGKAVSGIEGWKIYVLSSHADFEQDFGRKAVKKRKLYNGMIKCDLYMYY